MKLYITIKKTSLLDKQVEMLESLGDVIYMEELFTLDDALYLSDDDEKILAIDPDFYNWNLTNEHIDKIKNLKGICLDTTSFSWVDLDYCAKKGIPVTNVPKYSTDAVAEYAVFMMMALAKKLPLQLKNDFKCDYSNQYMMSNIACKKVGVIGLGNIGTAIAEMCNNMGMKVSYWSARSRNDKFKYMELDKLFRESDFIFPVFLSNDETRKIITDELINSMKDSASFVSIVHDDLYNHNLILDKVSSGELYGYAFEENDSDIKSFKGNVFVTSQYAWYTKEAMDNLTVIWLDSIKGVAKGKYVNKVN